MTHQLAFVISEASVILWFNVSTMRCFQCPTHHYVPSTNKLQARLEDADVQDVNEVTQVVSQQPVANIVWSLVGEGAAHWDEPHVPVPRQRDQKHPQDIC